MEITLADLVAARDELSTAVSGPLTAVCVGAPHFSLAEFAALRWSFNGRPIQEGVGFYASTGRHTLSELRVRGWLAELEAIGVQVVTDTCTYFAPVVPLGGGVVMTNSAKWAHYGSMELADQVAFGSLEECVESAIAGRIVRDDDLWCPA